MVGAGLMGLAPLASSLNWGEGFSREDGSDTGGGGALEPHCPTSELLGTCCATRRMHKNSGLQW